jgi:hypothetical protein
VRFSTTGLKATALVQLVRSDVQPAALEWGLGSGTAAESPIEEVNRVGDVEDAVVIGVGCVTAGGALGSQEKTVQHSDRIADVETPVSIGITAAERLVRLHAHLSIACEKRRGDVAADSDDVPHGRLRHAEARYEAEVGAVTKVCARGRIEAKHEEVVCSGGEGLAAIAGIDPAEGQSSLHAGFRVAIERRVAFQE